MRDSGLDISYAFAEALKKSVFDAADNGFKVEL
jgi:ketol-acid reductoisomerase